MPKPSEESIKRAHEILQNGNGTYKDDIRRVAEAIDAARVEALKDSADKQELAYKRGYDAGYNSGVAEQDFKLHERLMINKDGYRVGFEKGKAEGRAEMKEKAAKHFEKFESMLYGKDIAAAIRRLE